MTTVKILADDKEKLMPLVERVEVPFGEVHNDSIRALGTDFYQVQCSDGSLAMHYAFIVDPFEETYVKLKSLNRIKSPPTSVRAFDFFTIVAGRKLRDPEPLPIPKLSPDYFVQLSDDYMQRKPEEGIHLFLDSNRKVIPIYESDFKVIQELFAKRRKIK